MHMADAVVVLHLAFIVFEVAGGILVLRWRRLAWIHLPAAAWAVLIEFAGWICPLTPLENWLRARVGDATYTTTFVERYLIPVMYPSGLTRPPVRALLLTLSPINMSPTLCLLCLITGPLPASGTDRPPPGGPS